MTVNHNPIYLSVMTDVTETAGNVECFISRIRFVCVVYYHVCCILSLFSCCVNCVTLH